MNEEVPTVSRPTLSVIGIGKVGETLARLYHARGYSIVALSSRNVVRVSGLARSIGAAVVSPSMAARAADLTLIAVPDDAIAAVAAAVADGTELSGRAIVHTSGAHDAGILDPVRQRGAVVGSFHPVYPFADVDQSVRGLPGAAFAIEAGDQRLHGWLIELARVLDGAVIEVPPGKKALYHAALCIASNYTVTLYAAAERLLLSMEADRAAVDRALNGLMAGTLDNLREKGIPDALTGPLVRGDVGTLRAHVEALDAETAYLYRVLARASLPLLQARGTPLDEVRPLLEQD